MQCVWSFVVLHSTLLNDTWQRQYSQRSCRKTKTTHVVQTSNPRYDIIVKSESLSAAELPLHRLLPPQFSSPLQFLLHLLLHLLVSHQRLSLLCHFKVLLLSSAACCVVSFTAAGRLSGPSRSQLYTIVTYINRHSLTLHANTNTWQQHSARCVM